MFCFCFTFLIESPTRLFFLLLLSRAAANWSDDGSKHFCSIFNLGLFLRCLAFNSPFALGVGYAQAIPI